MANKVAVIMGSKSDWSTMQAAVEVLEQMGVEHTAEVVSAHRTPQKLSEFAESAVANGYAVIIAGPVVPPICPAWWPPIRACQYWVYRCKQTPKRRGQPLLHSANAQRCGCRHPRHRDCRGV